MKSGDTNRCLSTAASSCSCGGDVVTTLDITVLMGGPSAEREVSIMSGSAIAAALSRLGHSVTSADISAQDTSALDRMGMDLVFIALHGEFGESGEVQALCDAKGLKYTGSGERSSGVCMDKAATKQFVRKAGIQTPDWMIIEEFHPQEIADKWIQELPLPVVLKPVDGGSSVDVKIVYDIEARDEALEYLLDKYGRVMLERMVPGREFTVSILGEQSLPVLEVVPTRKFYDYEAKYADDAATRYVFEHGLCPDMVEACQADALKAHKILGCRDMSRVDFILDENRVMQFLEINTIPGFTSHSLLPKAAQRAGISFDEMIERIVESAMACNE